MKSFPSISECANHLSTQMPGEKCTLTSGTVANDQLNSRFFACGVRVSIAGKVPNRTITLVAVDLKRVESIRAYRKSHAASGEYHISNVILRNGGMDANVPTYVQGNRSTLAIQLRKYVGAWNYTAPKTEGDPRGQGWTVTVKKDITLDMIFGGVR